MNKARCPMLDGILGIERPIYSQMRKRFLKAAEGCKAQIDSFILDGQRGREDEELATDVAYIGPKEPEILLVISSGVHGPELGLGSGIKEDFMLNVIGNRPRLPSNFGVLLIHAVNAYGASWIHRTGVDNEDVNRNFLPHGEGYSYPGNSGYDRIRYNLNPTDMSWVSRNWHLIQLQGYRLQHGKRKLQQVLTMGQYKYPEGVMFGGTKPSPSNKILRRIIRKWVPGSVLLVGWLDLHSSLGEKYPTIITELPEASQQYIKGRRWYGEAMESTRFVDSVATPVHGYIEQGIVEEIAEINPHCHTYAYCAEFGTGVTIEEIAIAIWEDNWLRHHGELESERGETIKQDQYRVFFPADINLRQKFYDGGRSVISQTVGGLIQLAQAA